MSTVERNCKTEFSVTAAQPAGTVFQGVMNALKVIFRTVSNRISANSLTELDDHQLADIGLMRSDVDRALNTGLMEDPTRHLSKVAMVRARSRFQKISS